MTPKFEYDPEADAANLRFSSEAILESEEVSDGIIFDYDNNGRIVGMEVLDARHHLPPALLTAA
jgi:uncharacterized protein YuzE